MGWLAKKENKVQPQPKDEKTEKTETSKSQASWVGMRRSIQSVATFKSTKVVKDGGDGEQGPKKVTKEPRCKNFPCCFYIPLEIAMELFGMIDIVISTSAAIVCGIILALEPFAGLDHKVPLNMNKTLGLSRLLSLERILHAGGGELDLDLDQREIHTHSDSVPDIGGIDYAASFSETSTTLGPVLFDPEKFDYELMARSFSRIASHYQANLQEVDNDCGRDYLRNFLFTHELTLTNKLFEEVIYTLITAYILYAIFGGLLLTSLCCFRGYIFTKLMIIVLWSLQLFPSYYIIKAAIMSQSDRLCFLEYGIGKNIRGQSLIGHLLMWPLLTYKPYELFVWSNYIRKFFQNKEGKLLDESIFSKEREREFRNNPLGTSGIDTKHHYSHIVGRGNRLFRQQKSKSIHKQMAIFPWLAKAGAGGHHSHSSSDEDI